MPAGRRLVVPTLAAPQRVPAGGAAHTEGTRPLVSATPTYASHQLDTSILHAVANENDGSRSVPGGADHTPLVRWTMAKAYALRCLLNGPDVAAVLEAAAAARQQIPRV